MSLYEWKPEYAIGNSEIDNQHKQLFNIINDVHTSIQNNEIKESLTFFFSELLHYTEYHFSSEESLMEISNYPEFEEHKVKHKKFIDNINKEVEDSKNSISKGIKLLVFLNKWLVEHIRTKDKEFGSFLEKQEMS